SGDPSARADSGVTTLGIDTGANAFTRSDGGDFVADGFRAGMDIFSDGFAILANNGKFRVTDVTPGAITVRETLSPDLAVGDGDEALVTRGERGPVLDIFFNVQHGLDALFEQLVALTGPLPLVPGQTVSEFFDTLSLEVVNLLIDLDPATNPTPQQIEDLGKAYIANWSVEIDEGARVWGQLGLATTKGLFDPEAVRYWQNQEAQNEGADVDSGRGEAEADISLLDVIAFELDDPNRDGLSDDSFLNNHLLPMLGMPELFADFADILTDVGELLDDFVLGPVRVLLNPLQEAIADVKQVVKDFINDIIRERWGFDIEQFELLSKMGNKMDVKSIQIGDSIIPIYKPTDHEKIDFYMGIEGATQADPFQLPLDAIPGVEFYERPVAGVDNNVEFDKEKFAAYKDATQVAKMLLLMESPPDSESVGAGQLSALMSDALSVLNGTPTTYDWSLLNNVGNHGGNISTTTLPKPGQTVVQFTEKLAFPDGFLLDLEFVVFPSDARPWLRIIDGQSWRENSHTTVSTLFQVHVGEGDGSNKAVWEQAVAPGAYELQATWLFNVTSRIDDPNIPDPGDPAGDREDDRDLRPASEATYRIFDGSELIGTATVNQRAFPTEVQDDVDFLSFDRLIDRSDPSSPVEVFQIDSGMLRVELADDANGDISAGPLRVVSVADGAVVRVQREINPFNSNLLEVLPSGFSTQGTGWVDLVYDTGTGNFPIWESETLRPVFRTLFDDWQNFLSSGGVIINLDFPDFGDDLSTDPNSDPLIVPDNTIGPLLTAFDPLPAPEAVTGVDLVINGDETFGDAELGANPMLASITGNADDIDDIVTINVTGTVRIAGDVAGGGLLNINITAERIEIDPGVVVSSRQILGSDHRGDLSSDHSGNIALFAKEIVVGAGAAVLAHADSGFDSGNLTLTAFAVEDVTFDLSLQEGFQLVGAEALIEIEPEALLTGFDVTLSSSAATDKSASLDDALVTLIEALPDPLEVELRQAIEGSGIFDIAPAEAAAVLSESMSTVTLGAGSRIRADQNVLLHADASSAAQLDTSGRYLGLSYASSAPTALVDMQNGASLVAGGHIQIESEADNDLDLRTQVPITGDVAGVSVSFGKTRTTARTEIEVGAILEANTATIRSESTQSISNVAIAAGFADSGLVGAGVTLAVGFYQSSATALVAGTVTTAGDLLVEARALDIDNDTRSAATVIAEPGPSDALATVNDFLSRFDFSVRIGDRTINFNPRMPELGITLGTAMAFVESENIAAAIIEDGADVRVSGNLTIRAGADQLVRVNATGASFAAPSFGIGGAIAFSKFANQATAFVGTNAFVDVDHLLLVESDARFFDPVPAFDPDVDLSDFDFETGTDRIAEEFDDANAIGGRVADQLDDVQGHLQAALSDVNQIGTSYVHAGGATGATQSAGGVNIVDIYNMAGAGIASGARVNQRTTSAGADQDVVVDASATIDVTNLAGLQSVLSVGGLVTPGGVGVGGYFNGLFADNYARAYIDDLAHVSAAHDVSIHSFVRSDVLSVVQAGGEARDVAVDGALGLILLGHESLAFIEDRAVVEAGNELRLLAEDEAEVVHAAGGVARGVDAGVGVSAALTLMARPSTLFDRAELTVEDRVTDAGELSGGISEAFESFATGLTEGIEEGAVLGGSSTRAFIGDAVQAMGALGTGGDEGAVRAGTQILLDADSALEIYTISVSGGDSAEDPASLASGGEESIRGLSFGLGLSGDVAFNSIHHDVQTYLRDVATVAAPFVRLEATDAPFVTAGAGAVVYGDHVGLGGSFARNGLFATTRAFTQDTRVETPDIDLLANATPQVLAFSDGGSGSKRLLDIAGSVNKNDVRNVAEAALHNRTNAFVTGDVLLQGTATLAGVSDAGAASRNTNGFASFGAAVDLGELINEARAFVGPDARVTAEGDVHIHANAEENLLTVAASYVAADGDGQNNGLYRNDGDASPFSSTSREDIDQFPLLTTSVALADLDGDGNLDLVIGSFAQDARRYLNDGNGGYEDIAVLGIDLLDAVKGFEVDRLQSAATPPFTLAIATGDVDGDGDIDVIAGNHGEPNRLYLNDGQGNFGGGDGFLIGSGKMIGVFDPIAIESDTQPNRTFEDLRADVEVAVQAALATLGLAVDDIQVTMSPNGEIGFSSTRRILSETKKFVDAIDERRVDGLIETPGGAPLPFTFRYDGMDLDVALDPADTADNRTSKDLRDNIQNALNSALTAAGISAGGVLAELDENARITFRVVNHELGDTTGAVDLLEEKRTGPDNAQLAAGDPFSFIITLGEASLTVNVDPAESLSNTEVADLVDDIQQDVNAALTAAGFAENEILVQIDAEGRLAFVAVVHTLSGQEAAASQIDAHRIDGRIDGDEPISFVFTLSDKDATSSAGLADMDDDGDLDLVVGNLGQSNRLYLGVETGARLKPGKPLALTLNFNDQDLEVSIDRTATAANLVVEDLVQDIQAAVNAALTGSGRGAAGDILVQLAAGRITFSVTGPHTLADPTAAEDALAEERDQNFQFSIGFDIDVERDLTTSVAIADFDGDGRRDVVAGNVGLDLVGLIREGLIRAGDVLEDVLIDLADLVQEGLATLLDMIEAELIDRFDFDPGTRINIQDLLDEGLASLEDLAREGLVTIENFVSGILIQIDGLGGLLDSGLVTAQELLDAGLPDVGDVSLSELLESGVVFLEELIGDDLVDESDLEPGTDLGLNGLLSSLLTTIEDLVQTNIADLDDLLFDSIDLRELIASGIASLEELVEEELLGRLDFDLEDLGLDPSDLMQKFAVGAPTRVYLNNDDALPGFGGFQAPRDIDSRITLSLAIGDVDGDGDIDIVTGNALTPNRLYQNDGTGNFGLGSDITGDIDLTTAVALVDVDNNTTLDLVVGNLFTTNKLYLNDGMGSFSFDTQISADAFATTSITAGDVDGDGRADVIAGNSLPSIGVAGSVSLVTVDDRAQAHVDEGAIVLADHSVFVQAEGVTHVDALAGAKASGEDLGVGLSLAGTNVERDVAAFIQGGTVLAALGSGLSEPEGVFVSANAVDELLSFSAGDANTEDVALAASITLNTMDSHTRATISDGALVMALNPATTQTITVEVRADHQTHVQGAAGAFADASTVGIGAAANLAFLDKSVQAAVDTGARVNARHLVVIEATSDDEIDYVSSGGAGPVDINIAGSGSLSALTSLTQALVGERAVVDTPGNVVLAADSDTEIDTHAGATTIGNTLGFGASVSAIFHADTTEVLVSPEAQVKARGLLGTTDVRTGERDIGGDDVTRAIRGLSLSATSHERMDPVSGGAGAAVQLGVVGSLNFTILDEITRARIDEGALINQFELGDFAHADQRVVVLASDVTSVFGLAGAMSASLAVGVGAGIDFSTIRKDTEATVSGTVHANTDIEILAFSREELTSVTGTIEAALLAGIGASTAVHALDIHTQAAVGAGGRLFAVGSVLVHADDETEIDLFSGAPTAGLISSGGAAVGGALIEKSTEAFIDGGAEVTALGSTAGIQAPTGEFDETTLLEDLIEAAFGASGLVALETAANFVIDNPVTQAVADGLDAIFDILVTPVDLPELDRDLINPRRVVPATDVFRGVAVSATSRDDVETLSIALGGSPASALTVEFSGAAVLTASTTRAFVGDEAFVDAPSVRIVAGSDASAMHISGVLASGGQAALGPSMNATIVNNLTQAYIGKEAEVHSNNDIHVLAYANEDVLSIAAGFATASGELLGIPFLTALPFAGSLPVVFINTQTQAFIDEGAVVVAQGNVLVLAQDETDVDTLAGAAAFATGGVFSVGLGVSANAAIVQKDTRAWIGANAVVDAHARRGTVTVLQDDIVGGRLLTEAIRGVAVQARSLEDVQPLAFAGGEFSSFFSIDLGLSGSVNFVSVDADTSAYIDDGALINTQPLVTTDPAQIVSVGAGGDTRVYDIAVNLLGSSVALAGGIGVGVIRNDITAWVGDGAEIRARQDIKVFALSAIEVDSFVSGIGKSEFLGLVASVSMYAIHGDFNVEFAVPGLDPLKPLEFLNGVDIGETVQGWLDDNILSELDPEGGALGEKLVKVADFIDAGDAVGQAIHIQSPQSAVKNAVEGLSFDPAAAVDDDADSVELGTHGFAVGEAVLYDSGVVEVAGEEEDADSIGGLNDGQVYFVNFDESNPTKIRLHPTRADALTGENAIDLDPTAASGTAHSFQPENFGTQALVRGATLEAGRDVRIYAEEAVDVAMDTSYTFNFEGDNTLLALTHDRGFVSTVSVAEAGIRGAADVTAQRHVRVEGRTDNFQQIKAGTAANSSANITRAFIEGGTVRALVGDVVVDALSETDVLYAAIIPLSATPGMSGFELKDAQTQIRNIVDAHISDGAEVIAEQGAVLLTATDLPNVTVISFALTFNAAVFFDTIAVGVAMASTDVANRSLAFIDGATVRAPNGNVELSASSTPAVNTVAVGIAESDEATVTTGGSVVINTIANTVETRISGSADVEASGSVLLNALDRGIIIGLAGGAAFNTTITIGAAFTTNTIRNSIRSGIEASDVTAVTGDVDLLVHSYPEITVLAAGGARAEQAALGGAVPLNDIANTLDAHILGAAVVNAANRVRVRALDEATIVAIAGAGAGSEGFTAIGAAVAKNDIRNRLESYIQGATVGGTRIEVTADSNIDIAAFAVGGAGADTFALGGSVTINEIRMRLDASVSLGAQVRASDGLSITASDDSAIHALSGALGLSAGEAAIGVSAATNDIGNDVAAFVDGGTVHPSTDEVILLARTASLIRIGTLGGAGGERGALGGSISLNKTRNTVVARMSNGADVMAAGRIRLTAADDSVIEGVAGAVGVGEGGFGAAISTNDIGNTIVGLIDNAHVESSGGNVELNATASARITNITAGGAGADEFALGGSVTINEISSTLQAQIRNVALADTVRAAGDIVVSALDNATIESLAGSIAASGTTAVGAAIAKNLIGSEAHSDIDQAHVSASGDISVSAASTAEIMTLSAGLSGAGTVAITGAVSLNDMDVVLRASIAGGANVTADSDVNVQAVDGSLIQSLAGQVSGAETAGIGGSAAYNEINNRIESFIDDATVTSNNGSVHVLARSEATIENISAGGAGGIVGIAGSVGINLMSNQVTARITHATVTANDNVTVLADSINSITAFGGTLGVGYVGIGGTVFVSSLENTTRAFIDHSTLVARGNGAVATVKTFNPLTGVVGTETVRGLVVIASSLEDMEMISGTGSFGFVGIAANVVVTLVDDMTEASIDNSMVNSAGDRGSEVIVRAIQDTNVESISGSVAGGFVGVGVVVDTILITNTTRAFITDLDHINRTQIYSADGVEVSSRTRENVGSLVVGGSGGAVGGAHGVGVIEIDSSNEAFISEADVFSESDILVHAEDNARIVVDNAQVGVGVYAGVGASLVITEITNITRAHVTGAELNARRLTEVKAESTGSISSGVATGGAAVFGGVAGSVAVNSISTITQAFVTTGSRSSQINQDASFDGPFQDVMVAAHDRASIDDFTGAAGVAAAAGVGISVDVASIMNLTSASIEDDSLVSAARDVTVEATSDWDVNTSVVAFAGGIFGGSNGAISVVSIGGALDSQGAAEARKMESDTNGLISKSGGVEGLADDSTADAARTKTDTDRFSVSDNLSTSSPDTFGTDAFIGSGAVVVAGDDITVRATSNVDGFVDAGGLAISGFATGGSVAILTIENRTDASVGEGTVLSAGDDITVRSEGNVNSAPGKKVNTFAGVGGLVGLGAAVSSFNSDNDVSATVGVNTQIHNADQVQVIADTSSRVVANADGAAFGGAAVGIVISEGEETGTTQALLTEGVRVGDRTDPTRQVNSLLITATADNRVDVDATASSGGILAGNGAEATAVLEPTVHAGIGSNAVIDVSGDVLVDSLSVTDVDADADGDVFGGIAVGVNDVEVELTQRNSATIGDGVVITAGDDFRLLADTDNRADADAETGGAGVVDISFADASASVDDETHAAIGNGADITATETILVEARMETTARSRSFVDTGGLGVSSETESETQILASTTTDVGSAVLRAKDVDLLACVTDIDADADADSKASALGANSDAVTDLTTTSTAEVTLSSGARVFGPDAVDIRAEQATLDTVADSFAKANALGGDTDSESSNVLTAPTRVTAPADAEITTRNLTVEARVPVSPTYSAKARRDGAIIDVGDDSGSRTLIMNRTIAFSATVFLPGASPELEIAADGSVIRQDLITFTESAAEIILDDLRNTGDLSGSALFSVPASVYDAQSTVSAVISGTPTLDFQTGFESVLVINRSPKDLRVNDIDVQNETGQVDQNITIIAGDQSGFTPTVTTSPGQTPITIENIGPIDVLINGFIDNPFGTTSIITTAGDILSTHPSALIKTVELTLSAAGGRIGESGNPIRSETDLLTAHALNDIYVDDQEGDLRLVVVSSTSGLVDLTAAVSILDGSGDTNPEVSAATIILTAETGSIGTTTNPLEIDEFGTTSLRAFAEGDIVITDVTDGLLIGEVVSTTGDITLTLPDAPGPGQDLTLNAASVIRALAGAIDLLIGDDLTLVVGGVISASAALTLRFDEDDADLGVGAVVDLRGTLTAGSVLIVTGTDGDIVSLRQLPADTPTTIETNEGEDTIQLGSNATPLANTGGVLNTLDGAIIVRGGANNDRLDLDDSGHTLPNTGTITSLAVTGLGMSAGVQYEGMEDLQIHLGSGVDTVQVESTQDITRTLLQTGGGNDVIDVGNSSDQLNELDGLLEVSGEGGTDSLNAVDTGDTVSNTGRLNDTRLTGLGMGDPDQNALNETRGIFFGDLESINISLGSGADAFTVNAVTVAAAVNAGSGDDTLTVEDDLARIGARLLMQGGAGAGDTLVINTAVDSDLTLDVSGSLGVMTGATTPGQIDFEQVALLEVNLGDPADTVRIQDTAVPVTINAGGGDDDITVETVSHPTTITLGAGDDDVTIRDAVGDLSVDGTGPGFDTLIVDRSAQTAAVTNGLIEDDSDPVTDNTGVLRNVTSSDITFSSFEQFIVRLGTGNDTLTIDTTLSNTIVGVDGGGGDEQIFVLSIGRPETNVSGATGEDTLTVVIEGFPLADQFITLNLDVETLVVDNSNNTLEAVAWTLRNGEVLEADTIPGTSSISVINTEGAQLTRILGGTQSDTLGLVTETPAGIIGFIENNRVELRSGLAVLEPTGFDTFRHFEDVISFDGLVDGSAIYFEDGFRLTTAGSFVRDDTFSPAASGTGLFNLTSVAGNAFALYTVELASLLVGTHPVTFTGVTLNGATVQETFDVAGESGFQTFDFPASFNALTAVTWTPASVLVDNMVAAEVFSSGGAPAAVSPIKTVTLSGTITINATSRTIEGVGDGGFFSAGDGGSPNDVRLETSLTSGVLQFRFGGNLTIASFSNIQVTGANRGISLFAAGDVIVGSNITFDFSADGRLPGPGGGTGGFDGNRGSGGTGGTDGGNGG
ncbi:MAG: FG-GAP-like repeat-containing protein, partial [Planctomycetota bacterium]